MPQLKFPLLFGSPQFHLDFQMMMLSTMRNVLSCQRVCLLTGRIQDIFNGSRTIETSLCSISSKRTIYVCLNVQGGRCCTTKGVMNSILLFPVIKYLVGKAPKSAITRFGAESGTLLATASRTGFGGIV